MTVTTTTTMATATRATNGLSSLPDDLLSLIFRSVGPLDLAALAQTCRLLRDIVNSTGWSDHVRLHPRTSHSLTPALRTWSARAQVAYFARADRTWARRDLTAQPLLERFWPGKYQSLLASSPGRLVVIAGEALYAFRFTHDGDGHDDMDLAAAPGVHLEGVYTTNMAAAPATLVRDMTALTFIDEDGDGADRTLCVGFQDGTLERIVLPAADGPLPSAEDRQAMCAQPAALGPTLRTRYPIDHDGDGGSGGLVRSISRAGDAVLSLSSSGRAHLFRVDAGEDAETETASSTLDLARLSWCAHLSRSSTHAPYAVFGSSGHTPLVVHALDDTGALVRRPAAVLAATDEGRRPAVYSLCAPPADGPFGNPGAIVISGWFTGRVGIYDLRSHTRSATHDTSTGPAPLAPVLTLADPWQVESAYSVGAGGGGSAHVCAGTARHALVSIWDVRRRPTTAPRPARVPTVGGHPRHEYRWRTSAYAGWSVFGPGAGESSPVYAMLVERTRVFGTTHARPFVLDFGGGVGPGTYDFAPVVQGSVAVEGCDEQWRTRGVSRDFGARGWRNHGRARLLGGENSNNNNVQGGVIKYLHSSGLDK